MTLSGRVDLRIDGRPARLLAADRELQLRTRSPRALLRMATARVWRGRAAHTLSHLDATLRVYFLGLPIARIG